MSRQWNICIYLKDDSTAFLTLEITLRPSLSNLHVIQYK